MEFLFTQKQYQEIINFEDFAQVYELGLNDSLSSKLAEYIFNNDLEAEAVELANPNTRESAKLKYVEPESPKYTWYYKDTERLINKTSKDDTEWYLDDDDYLVTKFTEEEIDSSPFKKEFFTKKK